MTIRWKVLFLVAALFAVLAISEIYVARDVLIPSFTALERREAEVAMRRVDIALQRSFEQLQQGAISWGNWADTYRFVKDRNQHFIEANLTPIGLRELSVDLVIVEDLEGQTLTGAGYDLRSGHPLDVQLLRGPAAEGVFPSRDEILQAQAASGFLRTDKGVMLVASSPILDGVGRGPARGAVVLGKLLTDVEVSRLGAQAQANVSMSTPLPGGEHQRIAQTNDTTTISETLLDVSGRPAFSLSVHLPRDIMSSGRSAVRYASSYLIGAAILVVIGLAVTLNRVVLNPLAHMTRHAVKVGGHEDLTTRLNFERNDEIGVLAREFDRMVERVAHSRSQLVDQSFKAGFAELARGVLHNLGNAMTPIGVRLATLRTRLASATTDDLELVFSEMARSDADPQRKADLEEFARLACSQLAGTLKAARQDIELIAGQTSLVQGALAEQMRATGNEHVRESVRLRELLDRSLDVVPDRARHQLDIRIDPSLDALGVVHVPRTVLSLVLQNFVINAADSVRDAGRAVGSLRISAEILDQSDVRQLVIRCKDDGGGIAPENLQRVFEKGFSTKSRETNFGIGLHWCANAVGAMGGRVWATSAGVGRGATLHVMVPLTAPLTVATTLAA